MSHRDSCPSRWDAEREGQRAQEYGYGRWRNPYDDSSRPEQQCDEAADAWRGGYRRAESREEERHEEEAAQRRAEMRRAELQAEEDYYLSRQAVEAEAQQQEYYAELDRQHYKEIEKAGSLDARILNSQRTDADRLRDPSSSSRPSPETQEPPEVPHD